MEMVHFNFNQFLSTSISVLVFPFIPHYKTSQTPNIYNIYDCWSKKTRKYYVLINNFRLVSTMSSVGTSHRSILGMSGSTGVNHQVLVWNDVFLWYFIVFCLRVGSLHHFKVMVQSSAILTAGFRMVNDWLLASWLKSSDCRTPANKNTHLINFD